MENDPKIEVVVLIRDLIFETKIKSTAQSLGVGLAVARGLDELTKWLSGDSVRLVIIDLNTAGPAALDAIQAAKEREGVRVLGFVSHVDADLADLAKQAGADQVLPRSRFSANLPELLVP